MTVFTATELDQIDTLWRKRPVNDVWSGWAQPGDRLDEVWIFRTRANWRRFTLTKTATTFRLFDEKQRPVATARTLEDLLTRVDAIPGLSEPLKLD
jgi:hypothetical protein